MFIVLYRWRVKPQLERQFIESWSEITALYRKQFGSLGSRLHRGSDGLFYAYAQWETAEHRRQAFQNTPEIDAGEKMRTAIEESLPEIILENISDYLIFQKTK